ncbi:MAG: peptidoglycan DD-metalloendopeptidase family protein [Bacilli bacterium]
MDEEYEKIMKLRKQIKSRKIKPKKIKNKSPSYKYLSKFLITVVLTLIILILLKTNKTFKTTFYNYVYEQNISFAKINEKFESIFGTPLPFKEIFTDNSLAVFDEKLTFTNQNKYKDGVKLTVTQSYLVPALETGIVVFVGNKEGYGKTVVVEQADGLIVWYSNLKTIEVELYDYIKKGSLVGEVLDTNLYLVFIKDGKPLEYEDHI